MRMLAGPRRLAQFVVAVVLVGICTTQAATQNPDLKPTFGTVDLKAGFANDPFVKEIVAGGKKETKEGGVKAFVEDAPDFRLNYTAGAFALTIYAESKDDITLLINLPDGKFIAKAGGADKTPLLKFEKPQSGQYDIWVGSTKKDVLPKAVLKITELK